MLASSTITLSTVPFVAITPNKPMYSVPEGVITSYSIHYTKLYDVMPVGWFINEEYDGVYEEISEIKQLLKEKHLKVILETGELKTPKLIFIAAILAMESGADFIKTSTGKTSVSATPEAAIVMCKAIEWYYKKTGKMVGIKMAGGIVTVEDAILYYTIVENILGKEWLKPELFRIGASRLANNLISASVITSYSIHYTKLYETLYTDFHF